MLVIEHVDLYGTADRVPEGDLDYILPPGRAAIRRTGSRRHRHQLPVDGRATASRRSSRPASTRELIDLRWLDRASIDWDTIGESIKKTNAVLIVEQGARGTSYGGWLADEIQRRFFDWLDQPIERVTGGEASPDHLEGARARRDRPHRRGRRRPRDGCAAGWGRADGHRRPHARRARRGHRGRDPDLAAEGRRDRSPSVSRSPRSRPRRPSSSTRPRSAAPSPRLLVEPGDNVAVGAPIAVILAAGEGDDAVAAALAEAGVAGAPTPAPRRSEPSSRPPRLLRRRSVVVAPPPENTSSTRTATACSRARSSAGSRGARTST